MNWPERLRAETPPANASRGQAALTRNRKTMETFNRLNETNELIKEKAAVGKLAQLGQLLRARPRGFFFRFVDTLFSLFRSRRFARLGFGFSGRGLGFACAAGLSLPSRRTRRR